MPDATTKWASLLARPALRLDSDDIPPLLKQVSPSLWPLLFEHGYRIDGRRSIGHGYYEQSEIADWLRTSKANDIKQSWGLLAAHAPNLANTAIETVLWQPGQFPAFGCVDYEYFSTADVDKIRTLIELGAKVKANPFPLAAAQCSKPTTIYPQLLALGVVAQFDASAPKRFVFDAMQCKFVADDRWLKTLSTHVLENGSTGSVDISSVQPIDYPGQSACAALVTGGEAMHREEIDDEDFDMGPLRLTPCVDSRVVEQVWRRRDSHLETSDLQAVTNGLVPLRDRTNGRRYYLAYSMDLGCGGLSRPPMLLTWSQQPPFKLQVVDRFSPVSMALQAQCNIWKIETCLGIQGYGDSVESRASFQPWDASRTSSDFIDHFFAKQRTDWIDTTLKLDTPRLRQLEAAGAPATWVLAGIDAVTHSKLSLVERRQRTAWLFRDRVRLRTAFNAASYEQTKNVVFGLDDWLPREDWRPVIKALEQPINPEDPDSDYTVLHRLADDAQTQGKLHLACRLLRTTGKSCATKPIN